MADTVDTLLDAAPAGTVDNLLGPVASNVPQLSQWNPTLMDRVRDIAHDVRTSAPVETILGRTPEEIAANPALDSAPTTHDAGVMGLFDNKTPILKPYPNPTTALDGLHNWAAGVVNSVASPGGLVTVPLTGPAKVMGPIVQKALLLTFGAQGAKMSYDGAKDLVTKQWNTPTADELLDGKTAGSAAAKVMDVGNILAGGLMLLGGKEALTKAKPEAPPPPAPPADDWLPPAPAEPAPVQTTGTGEAVPPPEPSDTTLPAPAETVPVATAAPATPPGPSVAAAAGRAGTPVPAEPVAVPADGAQGTARPTTEISPAPETTPAPITATPPSEAELIPAASLPGAGEPSRIVGKVLDELTTARQPVPVSLLSDSGVAPEALATGYKLNDAGNAYEFTEPAATLTPEQQMARENVAAVAELAKVKQGETSDIQSPTPNLPQETTAPKLIPVDVTPADLKRASANVERPPDVLDAIKDNFPYGVRFPRADFADTVKTARGAAAELMSHTRGEAADVALDGLHRDGLFPQIETVDQLAEAMKAAGARRLNERAVSGEQARQLAEEQKRTEAFQATALRPRSSKTEPMPVNQLFPGDTFNLNGQPVKVEEHVSDAETGKPSSVRVSGAYGDQHLPVDAVVSMDKGSLQSPSLTQNILFHLDSLKLDTRGQLHAFGLVTEVWNTLIAGIKIAVRGGMALKDAIAAGIVKLKASGTDLKDFNEAAATVHLNETFGVRQFGQQLQDAADITGALKGEVTNTLYTRRPQEDDASYASRILQDVGGPDQAVHVFGDEHRLPQPVRMALGMQIVKTLDAAGRYQDAANFFDNHLAPATTDVAQGLAMLNAWGVMSKEGKLVWAQSKMAAARKDMLAPVTPDIEAAQTELQKQNAAGVERTAADPAVQAEAKAAVTDAVANSAETHQGIVMELTSPWRDSPFILNHAREQVHAKANELLNKSPRPIGFTPAQHLRAILDDLAKRAADIASGHYQGAEPGIILRDKLVQRLGISTDASTRLATALDKEFARQVKAAQEALPKRIARHIDRVKQGLPVDATESAVDKSIRQQLGTTKIKLGTLVREHWTKVDATGTALKDKLVQQAGLTGDAATRLADLIAKRFAALTENAKQTALERLLKPVQRIARPQLVDRLIKFSNQGAFDSEKYWNAIRPGLDLPEWTKTLRDRLAAIADRLAKIPGDRLEDTQRAQTDFINEVEKAKGISNTELGLAFYMQNILSGITTHVRVAIHTSAQMMGAVTAEMEQALIQGRLHDVPLIFEALARGTGKAFTQQKDIMRTGMVVGSKLQNVVPLSTLEHLQFGREGGTTAKQGKFAKMLLENKAATLLNAWKYNGRLITAQHMLYFKPAEEMKIALLASRQARTEGLRGQAAVDRARQIAGYGAGQVRAAEAQAVREGLTGTRAKMRTAEILQAGISPAIKENARDYALRQTFLNEPYGFVGGLAKAVQNAKTSDNATVALGARLIVPFTRIAANLFNEGLNYTPIGAARAAFSKTELLGNKFADITPEVRDDLRKELYAKAALGTMLTTAIAFKAAQGLNQANPDFAVYGAGPANPQDKNAWRAAGGIPYSVKIGGRYVSYANTPANVMLAALGNYLDASRDAMLYKRPGALRLAGDVPLRAAAALVGMRKVIMEQPYLQSLLQVASLSSEQNPEVSAKQTIKTISRTATSFVVPNIFRQLDKFYDPTAYDTKTLGGILTAQIPFVRQTGRPLLNALGQPIQSPVFGLLTGPAATDPLVQTLTQHNFWPSTPNRNQTTVNGVPLNDDEFYLYMKTRGEALAKMLAASNVAPMLDRLAISRDNLTTRSATAINPIAKAVLAKTADGLQNEVLGKYEAAANKQAEAAVIRVRGY